MKIDMAKLITGRAFRYHGCLLRRQEDVEPRAPGPFMRERVLEKLLYVLPCTSLSVEE